MKKTNAAKSKTKPAKAAATKAGTTKTKPPNNAKTKPATPAATPPEKKNAVPANNLPVSDDDQLRLDPAGRLNVDKMDEKSLRGTLADLAAAGFPGCEHKKSDSLDKLRAKVRKVLNDGKSREIIQRSEKRWTRIDPDKLKLDKGRECQGVFIDLRSAACIGCPDQRACRKEFFGNVINNWKNFRDKLEEGIQQDKTAAAAKAVTTDKLHQIGKKAAELAEKPVTTAFNPKKKIIVLSKGGNPLAKSGKIARAFGEEVLKRKPKTLGELRSIADRHVGRQTDEGFLKFAKSLMKSSEESPALIKYRKKLVK